MLKATSICYCVIREWHADNHCGLGNGGLRKTMGNSEMSGS